MRKLEHEGFKRLATRSHKELDLTDQRAVDDFFKAEKPDYVFLCAAKVGGIMGNSRYPAQFIYDNLMISSNVIHAAWRHGVKKLLNMGSSCIYPKLAPQPMKEDDLLTGLLEPTNEAYAVAKIAAIKMCRYYNQQYGTNFISVMPTNQYGPGDNFNMETAHLLPMVMRRLHLAKLLEAGDFAAISADLKRYRLGWDLDEKVNHDSKESLEEAANAVGAYRDRVVMWGDGSVSRELMASDDLADACVYLMQTKDYADIGELVNITAGNDIQLKALFEMVKEAVGFKGRIEYDTTKANGTPRKLMDAGRINGLGWSPKIPLEKGVRDFYAWYDSGVMSVRNRPQGARYRPRPDSCPSAPR